MSASLYVLIAASTTVVGTLLVTELIRRRIGTEEVDGDEAGLGVLSSQLAPSIEEIEAEDFSLYRGVADVLHIPQKPVGVRRASRPRKQKRHKIGKRLEKRIIKMWEKGVPIKKIAEELGISYSAVYRRVRKYRSGSP